MTDSVDQVGPNSQSTTHIPATISSQPDKTLKQYFDEKLHPHLSAALAACAKERPEDPVKFVGNFLLSQSQE